MSQITPLDTTQRSHGDGRPQHLTTQARASLVTGTTVRITARDHAFTIDEPHDLGGADSGANPVEHLLAALGSCQVITYQVWAEKLGITVEGIELDLTGEIDLRGFLGTADGVRPGFEGIEVHTTLTGPEPVERYQELVDIVERHCPVLDNLQNTVPVRAEVSIG